MPISWIVKALLVRFILFVGCLAGLAQIDLTLLLVGVAVTMAVLAFVHILTNPDSVKPAQDSGRIG